MIPKLAYISMASFGKNYDEFRQKFRRDELTNDDATVATRRFTN